MTSVRTTCFCFPLISLSTREMYSLSLVEHNTRDNWDLCGTGEIVSVTAVTGNKKLVWCN